MPTTVKKLLEDERFIVQVDREFSLTRSELWDWVTQSQLTGKWIGPWERIDDDHLKITLIQEEGSPISPARILELNDPDGYTLELGGMGEPWIVLVALSEAENDQSRFTIIQTLPSEEMVAPIQAGWEFYADCLAAAIENREVPQFETYWNPIE